MNSGFRWQPGVSARLQLFPHTFAFFYRHFRPATMFATALLLLISSLVVLAQPDPALCLEPGGLAGISVTVTNPTGAVQPATFTAILPAGLTAVANSCTATVNSGGCTIAADGASVSWGGDLAAGQSVTIVYRVQIAASVVVGAQLCAGNIINVGGVPANTQSCLTIACAPVTNVRVSDQKAGSFLAYPYYTSNANGTVDTRLSLTNINNVSAVAANLAYVHLFFIDGVSCDQTDFFVCLTPNATITLRASEIDPNVTGYMLAVAINAQGVPTQNNVLIGNAFVTNGDIVGNYGAESFWANSPSVATTDGPTATLYFDGVGYDQVPRQFAIEVQSPVDVTGQQVITAAIRGDLTTSQVTGAGQVGVALVYNEEETPFGSFSMWLTGACQARATLTATNPRVPGGLAALIKTGEAGTIKINVGAAVGLLVTPRNNTWNGIRMLHKTATTSATLTIPIFLPQCPPMTT